MSIDQIRYVRLGGVDQWVMLRGASTANPPLVLLHGGPGLAETGFFARYMAPLERHFTLVYWDQRGAGKSASRDIPASSMTVDQFLADLDELVDHVRERLGQPRVTIFGHSWGSLLGVLYAARCPDKVAAYVGSGQIGDWATAEAASYAYTLGEAERRGHERALRALRRIGPPPYPASAVFTERMWMARFDGMTSPGELRKTARAVLGAPGASILELPRAIRAFRWTMDVMWKDISQIDLRERVPALAMPVFFFLGRNDHFVPPETSVEYFDVLRAPVKQLVWFERSGHEPFVDEPDAFNREMIARVLPVAAASGTGQRATPALATVELWLS